MPRTEACLRAERLGDCKTDRLTASTISVIRKFRGRPFLHTSRSPEVLNPQQNGFSVRYSVPRGDLVASTERTLHRYDRVTANSRFRRQMRAARWTTPSLLLGRVVTGTLALFAFTYLHWIKFRGSIVR
jgi:hypothetical protein